MGNNSLSPTVSHSNVLPQFPLFDGHIRPFVRSPKLPLGELQAHSQVSCEMARGPSAPGPLKRSLDSSRSCNFHERSNPRGNVRLRLEVPGKLPPDISLHGEDPLASVPKPSVEFWGSGAEPRGSRFCKAGLLCRNLGSGVRRIPNPETTPNTSSNSRAWQRMSGP